jgi:hypothetical protein
MTSSDLPIDIKLATVRKNLALKSEISSWTKNENSSVTKVIQTLSFVEKNIE